MCENKTNYFYDNFGNLYIGILFIIFIFCIKYYTPQMIEKVFTPFEVILLILGFFTLPIIIILISYSLLFYLKHIIKDWLDL